MTDRNEKLRRAEILCLMCTKEKGRPVFHGWRKATGEEYKPVEEQNDSE